MIFVNDNKVSKKRNGRIFEHAFVPFHQLFEFFDKSEFRIRKKLGAIEMRKSLKMNLRRFETCLQP